MRLPVKNRFLHKLLLDTTLKINHIEYVQSPFTKKEIIFLLPLFFTEIIFETKLIILFFLLNYQIVHVK